MPAKPPEPEKSLEAIVDELQLYPIDAFHFVQQALSYAAQRVHGQRPDPESKHHITGQQLCEGIREFALNQWGMLAGCVLRKWNLRRTEDFGKIVFSLVSNRYMSKTDEDTIDDFINVYDFREAFDTGYKISCKNL